jgi:hypothetical protein
VTKGEQGDCVLTPQDPLPVADIISAISLADDLYRRRAEPDSGLRVAVALRKCPDYEGSYEILWRLARAMFLAGEQEHRKTSWVYHGSGAEFGWKALEINSDRVEGHFWLGVNLALMAQKSGGLRAVLALLAARSQLRRAARICESYHGAGPLRVLGRLEHKAPRILGGSLGRSRSYFERALQLAPDNCVTLVYAAELSIDSGEVDRARQMLRRVVESPIDPAWEFEHRRDKALAQTMLSRLEMS